MKVYLVRHGETDYNKIGRIQGRLPVSLNEKGHIQAKSIAENIASLNASHLYSSTLVRAKETALHISEVINLPIIFDNLLVERHYGVWQDKFWKDVFLENPNIKEEWCRVGVRFAPPKGESVKEMIHRTREFINKISTKHSSEDKILILTHGGMIKMFLGEANGLNEDVYYDQNLIKNCAIIELNIEDGKLKN